MPRRVLVWRGLDAWRAELAEVELGASALRARGTQLGVEPEPYRLDYELETAERFVTSRLALEARGAGTARRLELRRDAGGAWTAGNGVLPELEGALDCDLAFSALTNTMPVLREGVLTGGGARDFVMAWVSVPDLTVHRSEQSYEPLGERAVRYRSGSFSARLDLDEDGFVELYEGFLERV